MSDVDTSAEAVKRLTHGCENYNAEWMVTHGYEIAGTIRALLAERDAAKAEADRRTHEVELTYLVQRRLTTERDELRAEVERLRQKNAAYNDEHEIMV